MRLVSALPIFASCVLWAALAVLSGHAAAAERMQRDRVSAVESGQVIILAEHGRAAFADIIFPNDALADAWLAEHLLQHEITFTTTASDRYDRALIESDVQIDMLRDGVAVIFATSKTSPQWQAAETAARQAKRGIWANDNVVLNPQNAAQHLQQFHVVEGTITRIYRSKSAIYLNFGDNWRTDFSVTIPGRAKRSFTRLLPQLTEGTRIRIRGMIYEENGPMIRVSRPEHLEIF